MNAIKGIIEHNKSMASRALSVAAKDSSNPEMAMGLPKSQEPQRALDHSTSRPQKHEKQIWDSLGEPGKHYDFLVKYSPTYTSPKQSSNFSLTQSPSQSKDVPLDFI